MPEESLSDTRFYSSLQRKEIVSGLLHGNLNPIAAIIDM